MSSVGWRIALVALLLSATGCFTTPAGWACDVEVVCPSGYLCVSGFCEAVDAGAGNAGDGGPGKASDGGMGDAGSGASNDAGSVDITADDWASWPIPPDIPDAGEFTVTTDTVKDSITGLMWERTPATTCPGDLNGCIWAEAITRCRAAITGGYADWRLPSAIELLSIGDLNGASSGTDTTAFNNGTGGAAASLLFWTSECYGGPAACLASNENAAAWAVQFTNGPSTLDALVGNPGLVRCVRRPGSPEAGASPPPGRYTYPESGGEVLDTNTGLTWQQAVPSDPCPSDADGGCTWSDATGYCAGASVGGENSGWRLPTVKELSSIVDFTGSSPPYIDRTAFPSTPDAFFWASDCYGGPGTCEGTSGSAWFVSFGGLDTGPGANPVTDVYAVRCVR